jgi:hypothetical protein
VRILNSLPRGVSCKSFSLRVSGRRPEQSH